MRKLFQQEIYIQELKKVIEKSTEKQTLLEHGLNESNNLLREILRNLRSQGSQDGQILGSPNLKRLSSSAFQNTTNVPPEDHMNSSSSDVLTHDGNWASSATVLPTTSTSNGNGWGFLNSNSTLFYVSDLKMPVSEYLSGLIEHRVSYGVAPSSLPNQRKKRITSDLKVVTAFIAPFMNAGNVKSFMSRIEPRTGDISRIQWMIEKRDTINSLCLSVHEKLDTMLKNSGVRSLNSIVGLKKC